MVAAKPTEPRHLNIVRTHEWVGAFCEVCKLEMRMDKPLADLPPCPGPEFMIFWSDRINSRVENKH